MAAPTWKLQLRLAVWLSLTVPKVFADGNVGCFSYGFAYEFSLPVNERKPYVDSNGSTATCQARCQQLPECGHFTYEEASNQCFLAGTNATLVPFDGAVAGPSSCPQKPIACLTVPGVGFPGPTAANSAAAWEGGEVPTPGQCWPRSADGEELPCPAQPPVVLEDTALGWAGRCTGLKRVSLPSGETCQNSCLENPRCGVWSLSSDNVTCLQGGSGVDCSATSADAPAPQRAQRLMHGTFRVLKQLTNIQVMGLKQAFSGQAYATWQEGAPHCLMRCLADIRCQFWQMSDEAGCWLEDATEPIGYPLTSQPSSSTTESLASHFKAGEYIQRLCALGPLPPNAVSYIVKANGTAKEAAILSAETATTTAAGLLPWAWPEWLTWSLIAAAALLCVLAALAVCCCAGPKGKTRKRGLQGPYGEPNYYDGVAPGRSESEAMPLMPIGEQPPFAYALAGPPPSFAEPPPPSFSGVPYSFSTTQHTAMLPGGGSPWGLAPGGQVA